MFQLKNETPSPKRIGKSVKPRNSARLGPRKKSAQRPSRRARRRAVGRARTAVVSARVGSPEHHPERLFVLSSRGAERRGTSTVALIADRDDRWPARRSSSLLGSARNDITAGCYFFWDCR